MTMPSLLYKPPYCMPILKDLLTKAIVENAIRKLEKIPEPKCSQFVAATKAKFFAERDNSIRQKLAAAKCRSLLCRNMTCQEKNGSVSIFLTRATGSVLRTADNFCSAPIITGNATLPLRWLCQLPLCELATQNYLALQAVFVQ